MNHKNKPKRRRSRKQKGYEKKKGYGHPDRGKKQASSRARAQHELDKKLPAEHDEKVDNACEKMCKRVIRVRNRASIATRLISHSDVHATEPKLSVFVKSVINHGVV